ncbi:MAG TPA: oligoendopeptidase F [Victivallales bacterium]|nr:oligoendopeptidase F [Victivallales bacterium]HPO89781.1 oligoendopeptidase F [Victivallales bacterium]HRR29286.1 oligoendopeptidase F [Victivallales bacterium]HRU00135.1 oligoendopeptidase F [Victivallales bacterium]
MNYENFATIHRNDIPEEFKWDLSLIYKTEKAWEEDFKKLDEYISEIQKLKGKLKNSPQNIAKVLDLEDNISRIIENLSAFARHKSDENSSNNKYLAMSGKISTKAAEIDAKISWIDPEILEIDEETLIKYSENPELKFYKKTIKDLIREKKHTLSKNEEKILGLVSDSLSSSYETFNIISNSDLKFPEIQDENGTKRELTHSNFILFLRNQNRNVRKAAFENFYSIYEQFKNTFASILDGTIKANVFEMKVRNFEDSLEAALFDDKIPKSLYYNLIESVSENLNLVYEYFRLRKEKLNLDELHIYDTYHPIIECEDLKWSWNDAKKTVLESLSPLGENYIKVAEKAFSEKWIDVLPNRGKKSGAYSGGSYDSPPYILLNFNGRMEDVFTLAHELGHSIHSYYSNKTQKYHYADYSIFLAEIASITSELLLHFYLLRNSQNESLKKFLLNHIIDEFKATVVRQTMFAEFELIIHQKREHGEPLTADLLCDEYYKLIQKYFGNNVICDKLIELEWARIPHFHYGFYVYKYATGFAAAAKFANKIISGDSDAPGLYKNFISAGSSKDVIEILKDSDIDITDASFINDSFRIFDENVKEFFHN